MSSRGDMTSERAMTSTGPGFVAEQGGQAMKGVGTAFLMTTLLVTCAAPVQAGPVTIGGGWQSFTWQEGPDAWNEGGPFTYVGTDWTRLTLTDVAYCGDQFEVYNHGVPIGTTSVPTSSPRYSATSFEYCCENDHWSSGVFLLAPGLQSLTFKTIQTAQGYTAGNAYFRVDAATGPVPPAAAAPATVMLGMLGAGLVGWLLRRGIL